jgi:hypothetical protein
VLCLRNGKPANDSEQHAQCRQSVVYHAAQNNGCDEEAKANAEQAELHDLASR